MFGLVSSALRASLVTLLLCGFATALAHSLGWSRSKRGEWLRLLQWPVGR